MIALKIYAYVWSDDMDAGWLEYDPRLVFLSMTTAHPDEKVTVEILDHRTLKKERGEIVESLKSECGVEISRADLIFNVIHWRNVRGKTKRWGYIIVVFLEE